jgi:hypothetical protein
MAEDILDWWGVLFGVLTQIVDTGRSFERTVAAIGLRAPMEMARSG